MITKLLQKQLESELGFIYNNMYSFISRFFGEEDAILAKDGATSFYMAFDNKSIYIQRHWVDAENRSNVSEDSINYDEYNKWFEEVVGG